MAPKPNISSGQESRKEAFLTRRQVEVYTRPKLVNGWPLSRSGALQEDGGISYPVRGGVFRPYGDQEQQLDQFQALVESDQDTTSECPSAPDSPIFDPVDRSSIPSDGVQKAGWLGQSSSVSSMSSIESLEVPESKNRTGPSLMDARTRKEIDLDLDKYPSLDPATQDDIVRCYRQLGQIIHAQGLYQCHYTEYLIELCRYALLFALCLLFLRFGWPDIWALTHNFVFDTVIGVIVADFLGGLSLGWWKRNHNVHHIVTNSPEHDPDIEHVPFFAVSHRFFESLRSTFYDRVMIYDCVGKARHTISAPALLSDFDAGSVQFIHTELGVSVARARA
ncbi:MAG: hypothetical protein Q9226_000705 [Calogaya cf. arnoldii]